MDKNRMALLQKYIDEEPHNPFNRYALAMEYRGSEPELALKLLLELLAAHPDYLPPHYQAGQLLAESGNVRGAVEILKQGMVLAQRQGDQKALQELRKAILEIETD
jgi:predicted Zn-dependent protease